jgi:tetratricopeptide (TPR) repeat protein
MENMIIVLLFALLAAPPDGVDHYRKLERANRLVEEKKWQEAGRILKELSTAYPLHGAIWGQLGITLRRQNKHAKAIRAYEKVMEIQGPGIPYNARYWIAASHAALGHTKEALDTLEQLVFNDAYLSRPELMADPNFASLKDNARFHKIAGKEDVSGLSRIEGWQHDIDYLVAEQKRNNPDGYPIPEEFFRRQQELKESVPKLSDLEIVAGMGRMINVLNRGHTALWLGAPGSKLDFGPMPIRLYAFPEGIFITQGSKGHEDLAGAEVIQFGKTPAKDAVMLVSAARSGESPMENVWISPFMLAIPAVLNGLSITQQPDRAELTLRMPDGSTAVKTLKSIKATEFLLKLNPPPKVQAPLFLKNVKEMHWLQALPEHQAIYVQINNIMADKDETMAQFGLRLRRVIGEVKPRNIILDIRHNNGGDTFTYQELLRTLTAFSTIEGNKVFVLIGRNVYSAAANLTTDLERLVKPVFVGEPTSATGNQWGDESIFILPYSGIMGAFAGVRWQISHPWDMRRSIVPQVPVQLTAKAYFDGQDPVLDAVFRMIKDGKTGI